MFTLTKASKEVRLIIKWGLILLGILVSLLLIFRIGLYLKEVLFPTPPPEPTVTFGKLPPIGFPRQTENTKYTYTIDTISGELPSFNDQIKVYKMIKPVPDLLALNKIKGKVVAVGFEEKPAKISDSVYEFKDTTGTERKIDINILNGNFTLSSSLSSNSAIISGENLPTEETATEKAQEFLTNIGALSDNIDLGKTQTTLLSLTANQFLEATSLSNAQFIRVNFFQKDIDKLPIFYENPTLSNINILVSGGESGGQIVEANYFLEVPGKDNSTYPAISAQNALEQLKNGNAYVASYFGTDTNISIKDVFLAYYIGSGEQDYLLPIVVFEGNDGFFAYVSAVKDEWINK